jgi:hypothetical protein
VGLLILARACGAEPAPLSHIIMGEKALADADNPRTAATLHFIHKTFLLFFSFLFPYSNPKKKCEAFNSHRTDSFISFAFSSRFLDL